MYPLLKIAVLVSIELTVFGAVRPIRVAGWGGAQSDAHASSAQPDSKDEAWRKEFDDICSRTQDAMTFTPDELVSLISRCDALRPQIEKLDETRKKVYLGRLRMCRGLYAYVLESKRNEKK